MQNKQNSEFIQLVFENALKAPGNLVPWGMLAEIAKLRTTQDICKKYISYLQTGKPLTRRTAATLEGAARKNLSITFFSPSPCKRLLRHTLTARAAGMQVQLIVQYAGWQSHAVHEHLYDHILCINNPYFEMDTITRALREFESSLIHMVTSASTNQWLLPLALCSPLPVVGDPYDMCNAQFLDWPGYTKEFLSNSAYEKAWFQHTDGLCMRTHYLKSPRVRKLYIPGTPILHMIDAVRSQCFARNTQPINTKNFNLLMDGTSASNEYLAAEMHQFLKCVQAAGNITVHLYRHEDVDYSEFGDMVKTYPNLSVEEFERLLRSMDAYVMLANIEFNKWRCYTPEMPLYSTRSTASDIYEADIVFIVSSVNALNAHYAVQANRGIVFAPEEQTSPAFWRDLPQRVADLRQQEPRSQKFFDTSYAPHLDSFYRRVIRKALRKT